MNREQVLSNRRQLAGFLGSVAGLAILTSTLVATNRPFAVATSLSLYLLLLVAVTALGGHWPGLFAAVASPLLVNWFLIPPYRTFRISDRDNLVELAVFVSVAVIVSTFVSVAARNSGEARRAAHEATTLARLSEAGFSEPLSDIVELLRETFGFESVAVLRDDDTSYSAVATSGPHPPTSPQEATLSDHLGQKFVLVARGREPGERDRRVLNAFLGQLAKYLEQERLRRVELEAESLARSDELRTAILRAVSHDLRSPLASIKASVSSLRQDDIAWPDDVEAEFLESIEVQTDRLTSIVLNLLDLSRIEAGVLRPVMRSTSTVEVVSAALRNLDIDTRRVGIQISDDVADVEADPALLERAVANLLANALNWSDQVEVKAHNSASRVELAVIDHGPGIPTDKRHAVIQPFHRLTDSSTSGGIGLGLAIVDRLVEAMNGRLELRDTPDGGLTAVLILRRAGEAPR